MPDVFRNHFTVQGDERLGRTQPNSTSPVSRIIEQLPKLFEL